MITRFPDTSDTAGSPRNPYEAPAISGELRRIGQLVGQAKRRNPNVNPGEVRAICLDLIREM